MNLYSNSGIHACIDSSTSISLIFELVVSLILLPRYLLASSFLASATVIQVCIIRNQNASYTSFRSCDYSNRLSIHGIVCKIIMRVHRAAPKMTIIQKEKNMRVDKTNGIQAAK